MLSTVLIWLSASVAVLSLVDLFLPEAHKDWLSTVVIRTWSILDEVKKWSATDWLRIALPWGVMIYGLAIGVPTGAYVAWYVGRYVALNGSPFMMDSGIDKSWVSAFIALVGWPVYSVVFERPYY